MGDSIRRATEDLAGVSAVATGTVLTGHRSGPEEVETHAAAAGLSRATVLTHQGMRAHTDAAGDQLRLPVRIGIVRVHGRDRDTVQFEQYLVSIRGCPIPYGDSAAINGHVERPLQLRRRRQCEPRLHNCVVRCRSVPRARARRDDRAPSNTRSERGLFGLDGRVVQRANGRGHTHEGICARIIKNIPDPRCDRNTTRNIGPTGSRIGG